MLSVFYSLIPLLPQPYKADTAGVSVSPGFFLAEQTEAQCGCWPPITQPATLGRGLPIVCVRQGREGSQFL